MTATYDSEAAEDSDYDSEENMSPDDKDHSRSPTPRLPETDPTTEAKTANIEMQPKIIENPDLTATFSDEEDRSNSIAQHRPTSPRIPFYFGWETRYGVPHRLSPSETPSTNSGTGHIRIKTPPDLKHIYALRRLLLPDSSQGRNYQARRRDQVEQVSPLVGHRRDQLQLQPSLRQNPGLRRQLRLQHKPELDSRQGRP